MKHVQNWNSFKINEGIEKSFKKSTPYDFESLIKNFRDEKKLHPDLKAQDFFSKDEYDFLKKHN